MERNGASTVKIEDNLYLRLSPSKIRKAVNESHVVQALIIDPKHLVGSRSKIVDVISERINNQRISEKNSLKLSTTAPKNPLFIKGADQRTTLVAKEIQLLEETASNANKEKLQQIKLLKKNIQAASSNISQAMLQGGKTTQQIKIYKKDKPITYEVRYNKKPTGVASLSQIQRAVDSKLPRQGYVEFLQSNEMRRGFSSDIVQSLTKIKIDDTPMSMSFHRIKS